MDKMILAAGYDVRREAGILQVRDSGTDTCSHHKSPVYDISVSTYEQLKIVMKSSCHEIGRVILDHVLALDLKKDDFISLHNKGVELYISLPAIIRQKTVVFDSIIELAERSDTVTGVLVHTIDELAFAAEYMPNTDIIADFHIYTYNPYSFGFLYGLKQNLNLRGITYPYELNLKDLKLLAARTASYDMERTLTVYGHIPMMITSGCIKKTYDVCDHKREYKGDLYLKDRKGAEFSVFTDCSVCTNTIFNSVPLSLCDMMDEICSIGADRYRLCFTIETSEETERILRAFIGKGSLKDMKTTSGHIKRGAI